MTLAPIALFAYNRPDHIRATLAALAGNELASKSDLYVFSDGPKDARSEALVQQVRMRIRAASGFRSVTLVERPTNAGLVRAITEGVARMCADHGRVIVLEDDLVTAPQFLSFMNEALDRYAQEPRVMQVSGYMYPIARSGEERAVFLPATSCWGWGTWKRAWDAYDPTMAGLEGLEADPERRRAFDLDGAYDYFAMAEGHRDGLVNSWGVVWHLSVFAKGGLVLYPLQSLVSNLGFDGSGTHASTSDLGKVPLAANSARFALPAAVEVDQAVYADVKSTIRGARKGWKHWLRSLLSA